MRWIAVALSFIVVFAGGCQSTSTTPDTQSVRRELADRLNSPLLARTNLQVERAIHDRLAQPLDADAAVEVALLNNRNVQAIYEELGVAQADLVQAGLLHNPVFSARIGLPDRASRKTYLDLAVEEDFVDLLFLSARKRIAEAQFAQTRAHVVDEVMQTAAQARVAFYEYQFALQELELRRSVEQAQSASYDAARRLREAGNTTQVELLQEQSQEQRAKLEVASAEGAANEAHERLTGLMGLWGEQTNWTAVPRLAEIPGVETSTDGLEALAVDRRADLEAARQDVIATAKSLGFTDATRFLGSASAGAEGERETDGQWRIGPTVSIPIPLFDQGQAAVARAHARLRQSQDRYYALTVQVRSEVRSASARMLNARSRVMLYQREVLPTQQQLLEQMQLQYNGMLVGVFQLLQAKRDEIDAGHDYISAVRDYWIARADLECVVGGRLPNAAPTTNSSVEAEVMP